MTRCSVPGCTSDSRKVKNISFHEFPCSEELRNEWVKAISRPSDKEGLEWVPTQYSYVCSLHFSKESYKPNYKKKLLKKNAVPSIFPSYQMCVWPDIYIEEQFSVEEIEGADEE